ncbi:MAG: bifunctional aspartate transaminase/aspartate 4-decarboxylase [Culturomica sp.]|jgi:aspartate 4-decarboxylase|nr:bifunctional aspartate transaminase/aspartate 4-decarboxylase [Culturomica sp.]
MDKLKTTRRKEQELEQLSPFELKDNLIKLAADKDKKPARAMLNAGRGNPNWIATIPREAFFLLGQFGVAECRLPMEKPEGVAGIPQTKGIAKRFEAFLEKSRTQPGADLLKQLYEYGMKKHHFKADDWVHELAEGIVGDQYPDPVRMLKHSEAIVHDYLLQEMCAGSPPPGTFDLFAVEGGTAAMCYIFDSLVQNGLLKKGDKIALGVPVFTPYLEIPELDRYRFKIVKVYASEKNENGASTFQYPEEELDKLGDKSIKAFFVVNPSNPTSVAIGEKCKKYLEKVIKNLNPNLMILTDDVYGTFVEGFGSLMKDLPHNTLCVYSFSKYFGATGWRLGVVALHEHNIFDQMLTAVPQKEKERLSKRYESLTLHPEKLKFIDRLVADSRQIALNHTAGLSTPQQMQMVLFAAFALLDQQNSYKKSCIELLHHRYKLLWEGMKMEIAPDPTRACYYCEIDMKEWGIKNYGKEFIAYLEKNFEPVDIVFRLAEKSSVVLLNGGGFAGPEWSVRVSLANLNDESYYTIGKYLAETMQEYVDAWKQSQARPTV